MPWRWMNVNGAGTPSIQKADTCEELFEAAGFGAVDMDKPLKGVIAMQIPDPLFADGERVLIKVGSRRQRVKIHQALYRNGWRYAVQYQCDCGFRGWRTMTLWRKEKEILARLQPEPKT